jgi:hypothetical protein
VQRVYEAATAADPRRLAAGVVNGGEASPVARLDDRRAAR